MKFILAAFLFISSGSFAQSSKISDSDLFTLGRVWGLMKYYHPAVSQGKPDWDSVLISVLNDQSKKTPDQIIANWIHIADNTPAGNTSPEKNKCDSITIRNYNISWIEKLRLNAANKKALSALVSQPKNIGFYYTHPDADVIRFRSGNEKTYDHFSPIIKMLELFRVWNAVEYFYPYKYLLDNKWDNVLKKFIPLFKNIRNEKDYKSVVMQLAGELQDTHTNFQSTYQYDVFGKLTSPFTFQTFEDGLIITAVKDEAKMQKAGIGVNDFITKIDGKSIKQIISERSKYFSASNRSVVLREAYNYLFSSNDSVCRAEGVKANGQKFSTSFTRIERVFLKEWDQDGIPACHLSYKGKNYTYQVWNNDESRLNPVFKLDDKVYIEFSSLRPKEIDSIMNTCKNAKGIVVDLRSYNDDGNLMRIFNFLFSKPQHFGIKTQPDFNAPGKFCFVDNIIDERLKLIGKENPDAYKGKTIVLINEYTQSAEELWAMLFKKVPGVVFIGSQTAGADGNITNIKLTDGNEIRFSGLGIYYPDGAETQRIGIRPDIKVRPTIKSIRDKEDLLLMKAFELIDGIKAE